MEEYIFIYFLVCKGLLLLLSNNDVGVARGTVFRRYGGQPVSKPAVSLNSSWGGGLP